MARQIEHGTEMLKTVYEKNEFEFFVRFGS